METVNGGEGRPTWRFPAAFWIAGGIELFERAAFYGTFITLTLFLSRVVGFTDVEAAWIGGWFAALIYLLPTFTGAAADRMGFRAALILAFALLAAGYATLGLYPGKVPVLLALVAIVVGGSFVKPIITGTVARTSDAVNRARAYSLFYMMVNIGSFTGKTVAKPVRVELGLDHVPLYSAGAAFVALVVVAFAYWPVEDRERRPRSAMETLRGMGRALADLRFLALILITAGFWAIQHQMYATMPKYVLRLVGEHAAPEWYANVNPLVVVLLVVPVTQLVRRLRPVTSIGIALLLIPFSSLTMAMAHEVHGRIAVLGYALHPITVMMVLGIAIQGLAECFLSPRYLEYASRQAPPGQEGLYMGYAHINTFFANLFGFVLSGYLLEAYCPDPRTLAPAVRAQYEAALAGTAPLPAAYAHAHYIWYAFAGIGFVTFFCLLVFQWVTSRLDRARAAA